MSDSENFGESFSFDLVKDGNIWYMETDWHTADELLLILENIKTIILEHK